MNLFAKKPASAERAPSTKNTKATPSVKSSSVKTSSWTNGSVLGARAVSVLIMLGWLCGPLALGVAFARPPAKPVAAQSSTDAPLTALQQSAGSFAVGFVGAWLSSTTNDTAALDPYLSVAPATLGDQPFDSRNLAVAEIRPVPDSDLVAVLVGADVYEKPAAADPPLWVRRYFEVSVSTATGTLSVLGLPAPKAGPATTTTTGLGYSNQLTSNASAAETVSLLLGAYLTGQGATTAYLSPGAELAPITPAPYVKLTTVSMVSDVAPADSPADGDQLHVQAVVALSNANAQAVTATYWVHLTARAGRWEVTDLDATAPDSSPHPSTTTPSPTDDTTEGAQP